MRQRTEVERKLSERVDQRVLGWYGHIIRMNMDHMTKKVLKAEVTGESEKKV